jgi:anti-sigma-K factor RskA
MSGSLRYKDPIICEHLASQYVMSVMTPRVRARIECLRQHVPELDDAIVSWSESIAKIHEELPEKQPSSKVWKKIENAITSQSVVSDQAKERLSWWDSLFFWRWTGIGASIASFALVLVLSIDTSRPHVVTPLISAVPNYTAVMSPVIDGTKNSDDIRFVVNVYQKTATEPSRLFIQWSERKPRVNTVNMHVWAENQSTGEMTYIGMEPNDAKILSLNKDTWKAVANSSNLFFTNDMNKPNTANTLFSGPCIQLGSWKKSV